MIGTPARDFDRTLIDWITVTSDDGGALRDCLRGPVETLRNGRGVYARAQRDGHGAIYLSGGPEGGRFLLQLSGEPLASWRSVSDQHELVAHLASNGARCTRLDLARDTAGIWTPERLRGYLESDRYVTDWRKPPEYRHQQNGPLTVYLGSRKSDFYLRVYDKRGQLLANGETCLHERLTRWEEEIKGQLAPVAFQMLWMEPSVINLDTGEETEGVRWRIDRLHTAWLGSRLRLTTEPVRRKTKEQSRAEIDPEWAEFLAESNGSELVADEDKRTPAQQAEEFTRSLVKGHAGSFSTLVELAGPDGLAELLRYGALRRSAKHRMFVERIAETRPAVRRILSLDE